MISFKNFSYKYLSSEKINIDNLSLDIKKGECVLFTGNSGSGKTSILRLINGLSPSYFNGGYSGEFKVAHLKIGDSLSEFSKVVGSVFQNPKNQFFHLDSTSELAFSMENYGASREEILQRIEKVAREFDAEHLLNREILTLSGGEKQRLAFMASMMMQAEIFVLDEITSNLDLKGIKLISKIIKKLKDAGKTIIIAEHRIYYLKDIIDRMFIIKDGKILKEISKVELENFDGSCLNTRQIDLKKVELKEKTKIAKKNNYLHIKRLEYKVANKKITIKDESFDSKKVYTIIGENGCGKTTFANALTGLKNDAQEIYLNGKLLKKKTDLLKNTFQVMQDVNYQLFSNKVETEIKIGLNDFTNFDTIVEKLKINNYLDRHPNTLSGGEKQRTAVASALLSEKKILIFDEPTSGLDYQNMRQLVELLDEVKLKDVVIFIITHDYEFLCNVSDEVLYFDNNGLKKRIDVTKENKEEIFKLLND